MGIGSVQGSPFEHRLDQDDCHELIAGKGIFGHLAITRLEDVQRERWRVGTGQGSARGTAGIDSRNH